MAIRKIPELERRTKHAQRLAYLSFWAEELPKLGFQIAMDEQKLQLRASCRACGLVYKDRFGFAQDHSQECPGLLDMQLNEAGEPTVRPGEVVATFDLPKPGKAAKRLVKWTGADGKELEAVVTIKVEKQQQGRAA